MTRNELIAALSARFPQLAHEDAQLSVRVILEGIGDALCAGGRVEIRGFGSLAAGFRRARAARNPRTGERVAVPGKCAPHFKPGKSLRESVNPGDTAAQPGIRATTRHQAAYREMADTE